MENEQKIAQVNRGKEIQPKHRYYQEHKHEIMNHADAFGKIRTSDVWGIGLEALDKMLERRGDGKTPAVDKRAMFQTSESYYESIVKSIVTTISKLQGEVAQRDTRIAELRQEVDKLNVEKKSWAYLFQKKEETVMQELLNQIK